MSGVFLFTFEFIGTSLCILEVDHEIEITLRTGVHKRKK